MSDIFEKILNEEVSRFINYAKKTGSYDIIYEDKEPLVKADQKSKNQFSQKVKDLMKYIPKFVPNEAWGNPNSLERQQVDDLFKWVREDAAKQKTGMEAVTIAFKFITDLQTNKEVQGTRFQAMGGILRRLIMLESLRHMIESYTDSSAGFVFEGFLSALLGGKQHIEKEGGELLITDVTGFAGTNVPVDISLKLLSGGKPTGDKLTPATGIHGSYKNMLVQLNSKGYIVYLIAYKQYVEGKEGAQSLSLGQFNIDRNNFFDIMLETGNAKKLMSVKKETIINILTEQRDSDLAKTIMSLESFGALAKEYEKMKSYGNEQSEEVVTEETERQVAPEDLNARKLEVDPAGHWLKVVNKRLAKWDAYDDGLRLLSDLNQMAGAEGGMNPGDGGERLWNILHGLMSATGEATEKTQWTIGRDHYEKFSGMAYEKGEGVEKVRKDPRLTYTDSEGKEVPVTSVGSAKAYFKSLAPEKQAEFGKQFGLSGRGLSAASIGRAYAASKEQDYKPFRSKEVKARYDFTDLGSITVNQTKIMEIAQYYADQITQQIVDAFRLLTSITENTNQYFTQTNRQSAAANANQAADGASGFETRARGEFGFKGQSAKSGTQDTQAASDFNLKSVDASGRSVNETKKNK